jgi:hypothetical protein
MISRRNALLSTLFGAGYVGLRALATGLPVSLLLDPRKALANPPAPTNPLAQFIIFQTSGNGDPINANAPGTFDDLNGSAMTSGIAHSAAASMAKTSLTLGSQSYNAALPWAQPYQSAPGVITPSLWQSVLNRTTFWHIATTTPVHPKEPDVLKLMDQTQADEMLGASSPSEGLVYGGQAQPLIPPTALKATLTAPAGPLSSLQAIRDQTMNSLYDLYKTTGATPAQKAYVDALATTQTQARSISQTLLSQLDSIKDNSVASQITAALALIQMKVMPAATIHVPFGGDNHSDAALATESQQTSSLSAAGTFSPTALTGVPAIAALMSAIYAANLQDQVTFMSLNVFGRTLATSTGAGTGRQHNPNHHVAVTIGKAFRPGVIGGVAPLTGNNADYGAVAFDSKTGVGSSSGDITPATSLPSWGQTMMAAVGVDAGTIASSITAGSVITGALAT